MTYLKRENNFIIPMMNLSILKEFLDYVKIYQLILLSWKKLPMFTYTQQVLLTDLGTWGSLYKHLSLDADQNAVQGDKVMMYDSTNNIIKVPNDKLVVLQGLEGYIVVEDNGVLLVCKKEQEQKIKQFVTDLKQKGNTDKV